MNPGKTFLKLTVLVANHILIRLVGHKTVIRPTSLRRERNYVLLYQTWIWGALHVRFFFMFSKTSLLFLLGFLPILILSILNFYVHISLKQLQERIARRKRYVETCEYITVF